MKFNGYRLDAVHDVILGALENAVFINVPRFHVIGSGRAGIKEIGNLRRSPGPEGLWGDFRRNSEGNLHLRISAGMENRLPILPGFGVVSDGIK